MRLSPIWTSALQVTSAADNGMQVDTAARSRFSIPNQERRCTMPYNSQYQP